MNIDLLIREHLSFRNYRQGRAALEGVDAGSRIRRSIWRDEGVDVEALTGSDIPEDDPCRQILDMERAIVRVGLFRRKKERTFIAGLKDPERVLDRGADAPLKATLISSNLLCVPLICKEGADLFSGISGISLPVAIQIDPPPLEPMNRSDASRSSGGEGDDQSLFDRKVTKDRELVLKGGRRIADLSSLIIAIMEIGDDELSELLSSGRLTSFARRGLGSPSLEAIFTDLSSPGQIGNIASSRQRFALWMMEGPLGKRTVSDVIAPLLGRMEKCGRKEAYRIGAMLDPLMDERSAQSILDMMFRAPPANRPPIIRLLASTMSDLAVDPLTKLADMSSVQTDREEARSALERMGVKGPKSANRL